MTLPTPIQFIGTPQPAGATAGLYAWGAATEPDGSILIGDYWNYRIVHYNADGTPATPFVFTSNHGNGIGTNQAPFGICVDPGTGNVFMTEGSLYDVNEYDPNGVFITSWGTTQAVHPVAFTYPSQCTVNPATHLLYVSNQWAKSIVILDPNNPSTPGQFVSPPSPNTFIQPRGLAFDASGNLWLADEGHKRIDVYLKGASLSGAPNLKISAPPCDPSCTNTTTFDIRGLAIDTVNNLVFVANGQGCVVQEFNGIVDPGNLRDPLNGQFQRNFNGVLAGFSDCGTGNGQFEDGAREIAVTSQVVAGVVQPQVWVGDLGDFRAQVFTEDGAFQFAVPGTPAPPPTGGFNGPRGVAFDAAGNMYVTDMYNERVQEFAPVPPVPPATVTTYAFVRAWGMRGDSPGSFNYPRLDCIDPVSTDLIVANTDSNMIVAWKVSVDPPRVDWSSTTGAPPVGTLATPYGVACGADGTIYVANSNAKNIAVFTSAGLPGTVPTIGSNIGFVRGIWVDNSDGSIWVDVGANGKVFHYSSAGALLFQFTLPSQVINGRTAAPMPFGIAGDAGYIYIALSSPNDMAQCTKSGVTVITPCTIFSSYGVQPGFMRTPQGVTLGPDGNLYITEDNNNRISEWAVP